MKESTKAKLDKCAKGFDSISNRRKIMEILETETDFNGLSGVSPNGEDVVISGSLEGLEVITYQSNGWIRINHYDEDGYLCDEMYKGKWK